MSLKTLLLCLCGLFLFGAGLSVQAAQTAQTARVAWRWVDTGLRISASEAAARVQRRVGGRILAVETVQGRGGWYYRIKVLTRRGEVRVYRVDASSGRMQ